ncbi:MAG TPA: septum formation initiator family protein [Candidatus Eisenbacteria bacterium]|jgi:cell division protein FtsB
MRDIGMRIRRYRLGRYATSASPRARWRWVWVVAALWLAWAGLLSEHSLFRIWRLAHENAAARRDVERLRAEVARLEAELSDPQAGRLRAERWLRERDGMARRGEIVYRIHPQGADTVGR